MLLRAFKNYRQRKLAEEEALGGIFGAGFSTPGRKAAPMASEGDEYVSWREVQTFLEMAEQALRVRTQTNEALTKELESARSERRKVEKTSSAALEESTFLADHMQSLLDERASLKEALEKASREKEHLAVENELLRQELLEGAVLGEESSAALQLLARQQEELRMSQQRALQLENENVQLQARVSALERANAAQATAMLSCLEESERVRLQQLSLSASGSLCDSPLGPLGTAGHRSDFTDDSSAERGAGLALADAGATCHVELLVSEPSGSYVSCITPLGSATSTGGSAPSIFRSAESSPARDAHPAGPRAGGGGGGEKHGAQPPGRPRSAGKA